MRSILLALAVLLGSLAVPQSASAQFTGCNPCSMGSGMSAWINGQHDQNETSKHLLNGEVARVDGVIHWGQLYYRFVDNTPRIACFGSPQDSQSMGCQSPPVAECPSWAEGNYFLEVWWATDNPDAVSDDALHLHDCSAGSGERW